MHRNVHSVKASDYILWSRNSPLPYPRAEARRGHPTWQLLSDSNIINTSFRSHSPGLAQKQRLERHFSKLSLYTYLKYLQREGSHS